ncbi:MAG: phosphoglycolate phosphatase [Sulfolobus sp.]|nr:phosphoglycolate phosphatase [Sulfolobus sp.]
MVSERLDLRKVRLVLTDLDGTLTVSRDSYKLDLETIAALRRLEKLGIKVGLVSGNSYPVLRGLATYLGLSGGVVAENGCVVYHSGNYVAVCEPLDRKIAKEFADKFNLRESWQNEFRRFEYAFYPATVSQEMREWAESRGLMIKSSGYAVHITKNPEGKGRGVRKLLEMVGIDKSYVLGVGDSDTDVEFFREVGVRVAVANADESLKSASDFITRSPSSEGVREIVEMIVEELEHER